MGCRRPSSKQPQGGAGLSAFLGAPTRPQPPRDGAGRPTAGAVLRKGGQDGCQGACHNVLVAQGLGAATGSAKQQWAWLEGPISEPRSKELSRLYSQPRMKEGPEAPHGRPGCGQGRGLQERPQGGQSRMMSNTRALGPGGGGRALRPCTPSCQGCWENQNKGSRPETCR